MTNTNRAVLWVLLAFYALIVLQNGWLHEDAFITYRTVDNLLNGHGAVWNVGERVQVYTHPLWFFFIALAHAVSGEVYYTSIFVSWFCSVAAVAVVVFAVAATVRGAVAGLVLFCMCKAFVDYSTSGLENPLSNLLLALFLSVFFRASYSVRNMLLLSMLAALAALNRMDALLVYLPALVWYSARIETANRGRVLAALIIGFVPFALWEVFSLVYYGFLFPNTAYAKLNTGIASGELALQGLYYLLNSLRVDPLALAVCGTALAWCAYRRKWRQAAVGLGILLYLFYVVKIGGDYMTGRFVALPFFAAVCLLVHIWNFKENYAWAAVLVVGIGIGLAGSSPPPFSGTDYEQYGAEAERGIFDERANYHAATGLLKAWTAPEAVTYPRHQWVDLGKEMRAAAAQQERVVTTYYNLGILPFYAGDKFHHIDILGVTDPLLARLPAYANESWSPGHFERILPEGYVETLLYGANVISDRQLGALYDKLTLITQGPLLDGGRWRAIWSYHMGHYAALVDGGAYRSPSQEEVRASAARTQPRIRVRPALFERHVALGDIYFHSRAFVLAAQAYAQAIDVLDEDEQSTEQLRHAYLHWALSLYALGDQEGAVRSLQGFAAAKFSAEDTRLMLQRALTQIFGSSARPQ